MDPLDSETSTQNGHAHVRVAGKNPTPAATPPPAASVEEPQQKQPPKQRQQVVPPYWRHNRSSSHLSYHSADNTKPTRITLEDNTLEGSENLGALWARHVTIDDYIVVSGSAPGIGSYVVWNCTVETLDGGPMKIRKRYSEFDDLRRKLIKSFPHAAAAMPPLPPKSIVSKFRTKFLERRREGLTYFLNCVLLNPEFAGSPVLKDFLFS